LILAICAAGVAIALKWFMISLHFGKTSYHQYTEKLPSVLRHVLLALYWDLCANMVEPSCPHIE
jgi:hypothetical protein